MTGPGAATSLSSDFETFLKMLTTQMRKSGPAQPDRISRFRGSTGDILDR